MLLKVGENCHRNAPRPEKKNCTIKTLWAVHKYSDGSLLVKETENRWRVILSKGGKFLLSTVKTWIKLAPSWYRNSQITIRPIGEGLGVDKKAARQILKRDLQERKICSRFWSHSSTAEQSEHWIECCCSVLTKFVTCGKELWQVMKAGVENSVLKRNYKAWNGVERILSGRRMSGCKIACQDNADLFFGCCRNYPPWVCSWKDHSEQSLLFGSAGTSLRTHAPCQETSSSETTGSAVAWKLPFHCELDVLSVFLSNWSVWSDIPSVRHIWHRHSFSLSEDETAPKGELLSDTGDVQRDMTELMKEVSF